MEEPEEKPPPAVCAQRCLSRGQIRLQLALAGSTDLAPGSFLHLAQGYPADWYGGAWGRGRKVQESTQRVSQELELLQSRKKLKEMEGRKQRRRKGRCSHFPGAVPADSWTLTRAVLQPVDRKPPKASRFELASRHPSPWEEPLEQLWGASWQHEQPAATSKSRFSSKEHQGTSGHRNSS